MVVAQSTMTAEELAAWEADVRAGPMRRDYSSGPFRDAVAERYADGVLPYGALPALAHEFETPLATAASALLAMGFTVAATRGRGCGSKHADHRSADCLECRLIYRARAAERAAMKAARP